MNIKTNRFLLLLYLACSFCLVACLDEDEPEIRPIHEYSEATLQLKKICDENREIRRLLSRSIAQAAAINPDRDYNPVQSLEEFYYFVDTNIKSLPWSVRVGLTPDGELPSLYTRTDQGVGYFWFLVDQPLDELRGRGYFYPTVEFVEPFASWLTTYCQAWGSFLDSEESWNGLYYNMVKDDPDWGLTEGWYGEGNQWRTFNEFFARSLASPEMRPVADADVVLPADSYPKGTWAIDDNNQLVFTPDEVLQIKTARLSDIGQLIGRDSRYADAFAGGTLTHTFLDVNCYHRYHSPVDGTLRELRRIPGVAAGGGYTLWDNERKLYYYVNDLGFQMVETRACAIIETADFGLVAMLPVGMSQICSVNWLPELKVGQQLQRGTEMGYFQFGGSDIILLFQRGVDVSLLHNGDFTLMGQPYARLTNDK